MSAFVIVVAKPGDPPLFGHTIGDDFDGCSECFDAGRRALCTKPEPDTDGFNDLSARGIDQVSCINCGHPVSLARNLL